MEASDLSEILDKKFYEEAKNQPDLDSRIQSNASRMSLDEIIQFQGNSNTPSVKKYLSALMLTKLENEAPKGRQYQSVLSKAPLLLQHSPEYREAIANSCDSILISEVNEAKDENEIIEWCTLGADIRELSNKDLNGMALGFVDFGYFLTKSICEIIESPNGSKIIKILQNLYTAQEKLKFQNLEALNMSIHGYACSYIENVNDLNNLASEHPQRNIQEAHEILDILENLRYDDGSYINEIQEIRKKCTDIEPQRKKVVSPVVGNFYPQVKFFDYSTIPDDPIYILDSSQIVKQDHPLYAIRSTHFQVCIYNARWNDDQVAVKMYKSVTPQADWSMIYKEIRIYKKLSSLASHQNCFLKYYGTYVDGETINMVMEYYPNNLMGCITNLQTQNFKFNEEIIGTIFYKLLYSFYIMKENGIFHSDIKPHNFLVDQYWNIKIIDFSVSMIKNEDITSSATGNHPIQGTDGYISPEIENARINGYDQARYNPEKSDVFSLGLVFLQMLTYRNIKGLNTTEKNKELLSIVRSIQYPWVKDLLASMLYANPTERRTFKELMNLIPTATTPSINRNL
ncbi:hypothetical protein SteCoe_21968 [Stentor coeruleus]|uniref:Protein kinase domain-containing protein n=1 Tax=Stentor coeruleus TaxID=5963 RepID=A0A1R2BN43_9CILI|nr:hypothetical protein SteCoe_21968 [Stentor coeruleus]